MTCKRIKIERKSTPLSDFLCAETVLMFLFFAASRAFSFAFLTCALCGIGFVALYFISDFASKKFRFFSELPLFVLILSAICGIFDLKYRLAEIANGILTAAFVRFHTTVNLFETQKCGIFSLLFVVFAAAMAVVFTVRKRNFVLNLVVGIGIFIAISVLGSDNFAQLSALISALILLFYARPDVNFCSAIGRSLLIFAVFLPVLASTFAENLSQNIVQFIENSGNSYDGYALPNGEISNASAFETQDSAALEVVMDTPEPMYLHGFLGYNYENGSWQEPDFSLLTDEIDSFSYLKSEDFYADSQTLDLLNTAQNAEENSVEIRNLGADSQWLYLPNASRTSAKISNNYALGLENKSRFLKKTSAYGVNCAVELTDLISDFSEKVADLQDDSSSDSVKYLENAELVDEIYRENFTHVDEKIKRILDVQLADYSCESGDLSMAVNIIYDFLGGFSYDSSAEKLSVEDFLQTTRAGYSIHFASAATEIFRYYGIPARYAEGYAVTYDDVDGKLSGSPILLTDANFHAWAEFYLDGVGWIPFEATPEYFDKMPLPSGVSAEVGDLQSPIEQGGGGQIDEASGERIANEISDNNDDEYDNYDIYTTICLIFLAFVLAMLIFAAVRHARFRKMLRQDKAFALSCCAKILVCRYEIPLDFGGVYDFSAVGDDNLTGRLCGLQNDCINEYYAHNSEINSECGSAENLYSECRKKAFENIKFTEKIHCLLSEIF